MDDEDLFSYWILLRGMMNNQNLWFTKKERVSYGFRVQCLAGRYSWYRVVAKKSRRGVGSVDGEGK